ncbi:hypothetical protein D3C84_1187780 [compost metagenome]
MHSRHIQNNELNLQMFNPHRNDLFIIRTFDLETLTLQLHANLVAERSFNAKDENASHIAISPFLPTALASV